MSAPGDTTGGSNGTPESPTPTDPTQTPEVPASPEPAPVDPTPVDEPAPSEPVVSGPSIGTPIAPSEPASADVRFEIDATQDVHAISRYIYGVNEKDWSRAPFGLTLGRAGGNRWTAYNWENNASNAGSDWSHQNDGYLGGGDAPAGAVIDRVRAAHAADAAMLVTVPILDYVAADKNGNGDVAQSGNYLQTRFHQNQVRKGGALSSNPDLGDGAVYQDEFVAYLESTFPQARSDEVHTIFYSMDNEPDLWPETHPRIHPGRPSYAELSDRVMATAAMVKDVAGEDAVVFGPVNYGWMGLYNLQDAPDAGGRDFIEYFLEEMKQAEAEYGHRVVDVFDFHWYPEARGSSRVTEDASDSATAEARMQAPRSLWDPSYSENSWILGANGNEPLRLLRDVQDKIDAIYPGTRMAITEYYYGGGDHISGGVAQADVLGIFGRESVFAANHWHLGSTDDRFIYGAFEMYRNFDGNGGTFGDISVRAETDDVAGTSIYASTDSTDPDRMVLIAINKTGSARTAGIRLTATRQFGSAQVYQMTSGNPGPVAQGAVSIDGTNAFNYTLPPYSVSTLVLAR